MRAEEKAFAASVLRDARRGHSHLVMAPPSLPVRLLPRKAGVHLVRQLCPDEYLVPNRHRIVGITDASLNIIGISLLHITSESGKQTRQVVYVSENIFNIYLSESALKELGAIDKEFPNSVVSFCKTQCQAS